MRYFTSCLKKEIGLRKTRNALPPNTVSKAMKENLPFACENVKLLGMKKSKKSKSILILLPEMYFTMIFFFCCLEEYFNRIYLYILVFTFKRKKASNSLWPHRLM